MGKQILILAALLAICAAASTGAAPAQVGADDRQCAAVFTSVPEDTPMVEAIDIVHLTKRLPDIRAESMAETMRALPKVRAAQQAAEANDLEALAQFEREQYEFKLRTYGPEHPSTAGYESIIAQMRDRDGISSDTTGNFKHSYEVLLRTGGAASLSTRRAEFAYAVHLWKSGNCRAALQLHSAHQALIATDRSAIATAMRRAAATPPADGKRCDDLLSNGPVSGVADAFRGMFKLMGGTAVRKPTPEEKAELSQLRKTTSPEATSATAATQITAWRRQLEIFALTDGTKSANYIDALTNLGELMIGTGQLAAAEPLLREATATATSLAGANAGVTKFARYGLATSLIGQGRCSEALALSTATPPKPAGNATGIQIPELISPAQQANMTSSAQLLLIWRGIFDRLDKGQFEAVIADLPTMGKTAAATNEDWMIQFSRVVTGIAYIEAGRPLDAEKAVGDAPLRLNALTDKIPNDLLRVTAIFQMVRGRFSDMIATLKPTVEGTAGKPGTNDPSLVMLLATAELYVQHYEAAARLSAAASALSASDSGMLGTQTSADTLQASVTSLRGDDKAALAMADASLDRLKRKGGRLEPKWRDQLQAELETLRSDLLARLGKQKDAVSALARARTLKARYSRPDSTTMLLADLASAYLDRVSGAPAAAATRLRTLCSALQGDVGTAVARLNVAACEFEKAASLYSLSGTNPGEQRQLFTEAFTAVQRAQTSAAADAIARADARRTAAGAGAALVETYEGATARIGSIDKALNYLISQSGPDVEAARQAFVERRGHEEQSAINAARSISALFPRYWDLVNPQPVTLAALQGGPAPLLREGEALVVWALPTDPRDKGMVLAVSRSRVGWAGIGVNGSAVARAVQTLRRQVDPCGDGVGANCASAPREFSRATAHELYTLLLGQQEIQNVIAAEGIKSLLIVPSGPLNQLPPGLLIANAPGDAPSGDQSAEAMRAADWLIRHYAIAVLPSVSSLATLRGGNRAAVGKPAGLFMMADPDFGASSAPCSKRSAPPLLPDSYIVGGFAVRTAIATLCRLDGTRKEAEMLRLAMAPQSQDVLTGADAREFNLRTTPHIQRLEQAQVVAFATHGLTGGGAGGAEPALVLAQPRSDERTDNGLLTASKAALLKLRADWIILSACNTASPDAPASEGLSGLSRAFFYAGGRAVLASHWRVDDDATQLLVSSTITGWRKKGLSKAQSLREAMIGLIDRSASNEQAEGLAFPSAWAPFTLLGDPM
ncbi:MAG: CHAT domain-containing tetratricopeptide repeat protein [Sandarakinorhabdus sp.]